MMMREGNLHHFIIERDPGACSSETRRATHNMGMDASLAFHTLLSSILLYIDLASPDSHIGSSSSRSKCRVYQPACVPHPYAHNMLSHRGCGLRVGDLGSRCHPSCFTEHEALYAQIKRLHRL